jgi:hypothetical protein
MQNDGRIRDTDDPKKGTACVSIYSEERVEPHDEVRWCW